MATKKDRKFWSWVHRFMSGGYENIPYILLNEFPVLEWYKMSDGIMGYRYPLDPAYSQLFRTKIEDGVIFDWHRHSDCAEKITVASGVMIDLRTGKEYEKGQSIIYTKGVPHAVQSKPGEGELDIYVHFMPITTGNSALNSLYLH